MEVRIFPNSSRPGVGQKPRLESQRPLLPQHARHCPVLEAGSDLGFMVFPPLAPTEAYRLDYQGDGQYKFTFFVGALGKKWQPIFSLQISQPIGAVGSTREELTLHVPETAFTRDAAREMARVFIVPEDTGTPAGGIALRGATNFQTPPGWDTVYTPVFNNIERPVAPMLVVRVQTDWFAHETEFRYVLQPGEGLYGSHTLPIGQVFFVPREEVTLRECTHEELEALQKAKEDFHREKSNLTLATPYGLQYSPYYARRSRSSGEE